MQMVELNDLFDKKKIQQLKEKSITVQLGSSPNKQENTIIDSLTAKHKSITVQLGSSPNKQENSIIDSLTAKQ